MHELSVAQNIVEIIQQHVPESEWGRVAAVRLKVGAVAGIVPESLEFSFLEGWWTDAGTFDSLLRAGNLVAQMRRQAETVAVAAEVLQR